MWIAGFQIAGFYVWPSTPNTFVLIAAVNQSSTPRQTAPKKDSHPPLDSHATSVQAPTRSTAPWHKSTFAISLASGVLLWAAFPPLNFWPLAWVATLGWLILIQGATLKGKRPYFAIWCAALIHWMATLEGVRHAHPAVNLGWLLLSAYLACYLVAFVGISRLAVHQLRLPLFLVAPVGWAGLELARGHVITGFSMSLLAHTQVKQLAFVQISDVFGAYGVSFLIVLFTASLVQTVRWRKTLWAWIPLPISAVLLSLNMLYGNWRIEEAENFADSKPILRAALIQESIDSVFEYNPERSVASYLQYVRSSQQVATKHPGLDLIVWPESMFTVVTPEFLLDGPLQIPDIDSLEPNEYRDFVAQEVNRFAERRRRIAEMLNPQTPKSQRTKKPTALLVGMDTERHLDHGVEKYNSALLLDASGEIIDRYYKMHPVMFGEYIPFGHWLPWLYHMAPMSQGLSPGEHPKVFPIGAAQVAPSICFESTIPHLIRSQLAELKAAGAAPDVLVNLTNDGWFYGSSMLDSHLNCAIFRAIENRLPLLIAANTGFSAWIDSSGRLLAQGPRRAAGVIIASVQRDPRSSIYQSLGDLPAGLCLLLFLLTGIFGILVHTRGQFKPHKKG